MAEYTNDAAIFVALAVTLALGAVLRVRSPRNEAAASGYRACLWLLAVAGTSLVLRLGGIT